MGLLQYLKNRKLESDVKKLRGLLEVLEQRYQFNAYRVYCPQELLSNDKINRSLIECLVWYSGDIGALMDLYQKQSETYDDMKGCFWQVVKSKDRKVHSGLPNLIVSKMPTIIFGSGYSVECVVNKDDGEVDDNQTLIANTQKEILFEKLDLHRKFVSGEEKKSWSGHLAAKISIDPTLSKYPILEMYDRRYFDLQMNRGILEAIIFKTYYEVGESKYILKEFYTTDTDGMALVINKLYQFKDNKEIEVALTSIPDTSELMPEVKYPVKGMLAFEMPNIVAKDLVNGNPYGRSDILAKSTYDALDEIMTAIVEELRDNKTIRYIPENLIMKNTDGDFLRFNERVKNFMKVAGDKDQSGHNEITTTYIQDKTAEHYEKYKILIANACNQSELSPLSLGITGLESISSSDKSTRERAKTTLEMRNKKVQLWKAFMRKLITQLMVVNDTMQDKPVGLNYDNLTININFNDYVGSSIEERLAIWGANMVSGAVSIEEGVNRIYADDMSEDQKQEEINRLKIEKGIALDTPNVLDKVE